MPNHRHWHSARIVRGAAPLLAVGTGLLALPPLANGSASAESLTFKSVWTRTVTDGHPISFSSPNLAVLNGAPAVAVGDQGGDVDAFSLANGAPVPGWPASTGGIPVESTPSVAALTGGSPDDTVFVGVGTAAKPKAGGGYEAFKPNGTRFWFSTVHSRPGSTTPSAVVASLAVGDLQGGTDVVAPSIGQQEDALDAANGKVLSGFPWFQADSSFATPALADLYGTGKNEIVNGGGQTAGLAFGVHYTQGGHVSVMSRTGNAGAKYPNGGLMCTYNPNESVESSPAVGPFLAGGAEGIAVGTGSYFAGASDASVVLGVNAHCKLIWKAKLDGLTNASPALADLSGNGKLAVVEGTDNMHGGGSVYALNGANGSVIWHQKITGEVIGGVVTANLGGGYQDVIVNSTGGAWVLDGRTGQMLATLERGVGLQNCALVTDDPNGTIGITVAGYNANNVGALEHYELAGSKGSLVDVPGAWPMFHHDPSLSGNEAAPF